MFSCLDPRAARRALAAALMAWAGTAWAQADAGKPSTDVRYPGIGRAATAAEVAAWDIDVRPDFKGLPPGRGTVAQGERLWEAQCAGCHGIFGESNEVFSPIVGGTTREDVKTGRAARLRDDSFPQRTTLMRLSQLSTLWDYLYRAMPWTAPKTLKPDEVYALSAFILHLGHVLPADFELSNQNMAQVQALLPNRKGLSTQHALWPGTEFGGSRHPDVQGSACMHNCVPQSASLAITSTIPDYARSAHGDLATQQRLVGPQRGAPTAAAAPAAPSAAQREAAAATPVRELLQKNVCLVCHQLEGTLVGPGFREVAQRYGARADAKDYLLGKIRQGAVGQWGNIPMPPQSLDEADAQAIASWLAAGAKP